MKKGSRVSEETRKKMSEAHKGKPGPQHSEEVRERIAASRRGTTMSAETRAKISASLRAHQGPHPSKGKPLSREHRQLLSDAQKERRRAEGEAVRLAGEKGCPGCGVTKPLSEFNAKSSSSTGFASWCKVCTATAANAWRKKNAAREPSAVLVSKICRACNEERPIAEFGVQRGLPSGLARICKACESIRRLETTYHLGKGGYVALLELEGGCACCGSQEDLAVDHCHESLRVRGILCRPCNVSAGMAGDDPAKLRALASYLEGRAGVDMRDLLNQPLDISQPDVT